MHMILIIALLTLCLSGVSFAADAGSDSSAAGGSAVKDDAAVAAIDKFIAEQKEAGKITDKDGWRSRLPKPPKVSFDDKHDYYWVMETNKGTIKIKLMPGVAPMHVSSTIYLARLGFYDELSFHRVISDFMAQGGCPLGTGTGGPGYKYDGEFDKSVKHDKPYLLSMANAGPGTDGSQFFITFVKTPWLDGNHSIFGQAVEGTDVIDTLNKLGTQSGRPKEALSMKKTYIEVKAKK